MGDSNSIDFESYRIMLSDPDYADYKGPQFAKELGVPVTTIYNWNKKVDWESVKADRRKNYTRPTLEVDNSLLKATRKLDVAAIRTWYERFDNWTPASKVVNEQKLSESDLDAEIDAEIKRCAAAAVDGREIAPTPGGADAVFPAQPSSTEIH